MLSDDDKARIRLEEIFREEVRRQLQDDKVRTRSHRILAFFNSGLGIWLLSSIVLGFITWSYSTWSDSRSKVRENEATIEKLDVEIAARVERFRELLANATSAQTYYMALWSLDNPATIDKFTAGIFPEFASRSLRSLLWDLRSRVPRSEKVEISFALRTAETLSSRGAAAVKYFDQPNAADLPLNRKELEDSKRLIGKAFQQKRWNDLK